jgi:hypothetical protein
VKYLLIIASVLFSTQALAGTYADDSEKINFFKFKISTGWNVFGSYPVSDTTLPTACTAEGYFEDGTRVQFTKDLLSGENYFWVRNTDWTLVKGRDDEAKLHLNFYNGNRLVKGSARNWYLVEKNKDIIVIPHLGQIADAVWNATRLRIVMPGNNDNLTIVFPGRAVITQLVLCIDAYKKLNKPQAGTPSKPKPDLVYGKEKI